MNSLNGNPKTILVVDDDASVLKLTETYLEQEGYRVLAAEDAYEALEIEKEFAGPIDLLITDMCMPDMDGTLLSDEFMKLRPGAQVICISAFSEHQIQSRIPYARILSKPFDLYELGDMVKEPVMNPALQEAIS